MIRRKKAKKNIADAALFLRFHRSHEEQLTILDRRLGPDRGARRERARLTKLICSGYSGYGKRREET